MSKLYWRYAAMNAGKTAILLQVAFNYEERGQNVLIIKPAVDTKGGEKLVSRTGLERNVDFTIPPGMNLEHVLLQRITEATNKNQPIRCILVDEAQFLTPDQVDHLFSIAVKENIPVIAYGLRTDFRGNVFPGAARLLAIAHTIEEIKTICRCGKKAILNGRCTPNGVWLKEGDQVAIDNNEEIMYEALCGACYLSKVGNFTH